MARKFYRRFIEVPNVGNVCLGPNGHLTPEVPCGHCRRPMRYYKGAYDQFPWFCSKECEAGEAIQVRCEACNGAMRKPTVFGRYPDGREVIVCKSCALRAIHFYRKLVGFNSRFLKWAIKDRLVEVLERKLDLKSLAVEQDILTLRARTSIPKLRKSTPKAQAPAQPDIPGQKRYGKDPMLDGGPLDMAVQEKIRVGFLNPDGTFKEGHEEAGRHYREVYPRG